MSRSVSPGRLIVHEGVLQRVQRVPVKPWEVAGWLLGYWADDGEAVFITHVTPPASKGTALGVRVTGEGHLPRFDEAWEASGGIVTFLGDWHTHPGSPPLPSSRDRKALRTLAGDDDFGTPRPLMAIASTPRLPGADRLARLAFYLREPDDTIRRLIPTPTATLPAAVTEVPEWPWPNRRVRRQRTEPG